MNPLFVRSAALVFTTSLTLLCAACGKSGPIRLTVDQTVQLATLTLGGQPVMAAPFR